MEHVSPLDAAVYSVERLSRPFVKIIQTVLRDMAAMAHEMDAVFTSAAYGGIGAVSTVASHINLSYHHVCIPGIFVTTSSRSHNDTTVHPTGHSTAITTPHDRAPSWNLGIERPREDAVATNEGFA